MSDRPTNQTTKPEIGPQRRRSAETGRPLHCCCMCGSLGAWNPNWSFYGSAADEDEGRPLAKFCNDLCARAAGPNCENVTQQMKDKARDSEYQDPEPYKHPTPKPSYMQAARLQQEDRERSARIAIARRAREEVPNEC